MRVAPVGRTEWYLQAANFHDLNYQQTWEFNRLAADRQGAKVEHVKIVEGSVVVGLASVRIKTIPLLGIGIAYVGGGPLTRMDRGESPDTLQACIHALQREYVQHRKLVLRIAPPVVPPSQHPTVEAAYRTAGFTVVRESDAYRTSVIDLAKSTDELRAALSKRWRRQLTKSEKLDFHVRIGTDPRLFGEFHIMFDTFVEWKCFEVDHDAMFHFEVHSRSPESARYLVLLAETEGSLAYGLVLDALGDTAVYVLGASNPHLRSTRAGYFLNWRGILELKERGIRWYDLGGIDPKANPGGYEFKTGMGSRDTTAPGPFENRPDPVRGGLVSLAERGHRSLNALRWRVALLGSDHVRQKLIRRRTRDQAEANRSAK